MIVAETIEQTRALVAQARRDGHIIGLAPTMGALHEGHFSLIRRCRAECGYAVVSIFVNPTQFGPSEDLAAYPRSMEADCRRCEEMGVDLIFAPAVAEIYGQENLTWISVEKLGEHLCGSSRPGHFRGVCTVVAKLFNIVGPDVSYFGQKDGQQVAIIERMVRDLNMAVEIRRCPTVRESDGLALSSRNRYLGPEERRAAGCLWRALTRAEELVGAGQGGAAGVTAAMKEVIAKESLAQIDYISVVDSELLQPVDRIDRGVMIALAVRVGAVRLIDNILVDPSQE